MTAILFDTHAAMKDLTVAGHSEKEAEAIVDVMKNSQGDLMTKADGELIRRDIQIQARNTVIWLGSIVMVAVGALFILLRAFPPVS